MLSFKYIAALQNEIQRFRRCVRAELVCWDAKTAENPGKEENRGGEI